MKEPIISWAGDIQPYVIGAVIALMLIHIARAVVISAIYRYDDWRIDRQVRREFAEARAKRDNVPPEWQGAFDRARDRDPRKATESKPGPSDV